MQFWLCFSVGVLGVFSKGGLGWWPGGGGLCRCVGHVGWAGGQGWLVWLEVLAGRLGCWPGPMARAGGAWLSAGFFLLRCLVFVNLAIFSKGGVFGFCKFGHNFKGGGSLVYVNLAICSKGGVFGFL